MTILLEELKKQESVKFSDFFRVDISENDFDDKSNEKRELVVTLLKTGPGNQYHKNFYTKQALESVKKTLIERKKMFFNHAQNIENPDRDLRDWASSIIETWIDESNSQVKLKGRVKVHDNWLWERAKKATSELAVSIEGKGLGKTETIEGTTYNVIYEIPYINGVNWVDYPGNADMGVQLIEKDKKPEGDKNMDLREFMEKMSKKDLETLQQARPDLFESDRQSKDIQEQVSLLSEQMKKLKNENDATVKSLNDKVTVLENEKVSLLNKVEAHEIKEKENSKAQLVEKMLSESKLKAEHKTERFKQILMAVKEYKDGDKIVTESEQIKLLIEDREKVCIAEVAQPNQPGSNTESSLPVEEQHRLFVLNIFSEDIKEKEVITN